MKISAVDVYNQPYVNNATESKDITRELARSKRLALSGSFAGETSVIETPEKLITSKEREFFAGLFPENSEQIARHELFNRNGRVQTPNISKGIIVDSRV